MRHVVVKSLAEARAALAEPGPVVLESPVGAAGHQGIGWWQQLLRRLDGEFPGRDYAAVLDCADSPGAALAAIGAGIPCIRLDAPTEIVAKVRAIANAAGTEVRTTK